MTVKFCERGEGDSKEYWYQRDSVSFRLHNDNFVANLHEVMDDEMNIQETADAIYDRVCVEDPEEKDYWVHWRAEHTQEEWFKLEFMARKCASLLIRQTALETVVDHFNNRFAKEVLDDEVYIPEEWEDDEG